jgi:hypothetical protein
MKGCVFITKRIPMLSELPKVLSNSNIEKAVLTDILGNTDRGLRALSRYCLAGAIHLCFRL